MSKHFSSYSYLFAKTTPTGLTTFYSLYFNSNDQTAYFEYRPEGLDEGYRTVVLNGIDVSNDGFHHIAVSVFGNDLAVFVDGKQRFSQSLIASLEDGPGVLFIGRKLGEDSRLQGIHTQIIVYLTQEYRGTKSGWLLHNIV